MVPDETPGITGLLLAGGRSTRFGRDKALYRLEGVPQIRRVYDVLSAVSERVLISVRGADQRYDAVVPAEVHYVEDNRPDAGPLAGVVAGCAEASTPWLLIAACDLPHLTTGVLEHLLSARHDSVDAVVARTPDGRTHPHCALYRCAPAARAASTLLASNRRAFHALLDRLTIRIIDVPALPLHNVNRPSDVP